MTENYMIPCGACGALLYLPVGPDPWHLPWLGQPALSVTYHPFRRIDMRNPATLTHRTVWACEDCLMAGEYGTLSLSGYIPWGAYSHPDGLVNITPGLHSDEHAEDCSNRAYGDGRAWVDCGCGTITYSRSACEACGNPDHGARYAYTEWATAGPEGTSRSYEWQQERAS